MTLSFTARCILLLVAIVLFLWTAVLAADWVSFGTPGFIQNVGFACFAAAFLPWHGDTPA